MGCAPSMLEDDARAREEIEAQFIKGERGIDSKEPDQLLSTYLELESEILRRESTSPAPSFGQAVAKQRQLKQILQVAEQSATSLNEEHSDISSLILDLGIDRNPNFAAEHEEFMANTNRAVLNRNMVNILTSRLLKEENKIEIASKNVLQLQNLYQQQDMLLKNVFGDNYGSEKEQRIEEELDTLRNYRDTLASGELQWQDCANDVYSASELANHGLTALKRAGQERSIKMASDARDALQEAVFLLQISQETLSSVQFPYCTAREISAILQAVEYIFTDILIQERYQHSLQVYKNFQTRTVALHKWIIQTLNGSLKRDLSELDIKVAETAKLLRDERVSLICSKLGIKQRIVESMKIIPEATTMYQTPMLPESRYTQQNRYGDVMTPHKVDSVNKGYNVDDRRIFSDPNIQKEFEAKMAARRSAMWPSRRIEELRQLTRPSNPL